jgi:hypothetical protein
MVFFTMAGEYGPEIETRITYTIMVWANGSDRFFP